ncbi:hypothetical protein EZV73_02865 [Acidaminobacter sp. JC074]|uniref:SatD family protein n=1 Tax=Acidaminobacter sp. JC074 TaxID=2530199 RepID=UPI001F0E4E99|nr:SatD family protein [Acidaminobacter sp. JC074]MCH4886489.1 hypothetical protein [Acidaminobacter sp. JC074]
MYFVINIDVKYSKKHSNRQLLQDKLKRLCEHLNKESYVIAAFDIVLGDEIQGLIEASPDLISLLETLKAFEIKHDLKLYIGIGYGKIDTQLNTIDVEKNDGPAFHCARNAIIKAKKKGQPNTIIENLNFKSTQNLWNLYVKLKDNLSDQANFILESLYKEMPQKEIALRLDNQQSSISRTISRYYLVEIIQLKNSLIQLLSLTLKETSCN